jgi:hypothetical protein
VNTPQVWHTEKLERVVALNAVSQDWMMYSHSGRVGRVQRFHHSRLTMAPSSPVGFCMYWAFQRTGWMFALVDSSSSVDQYSGQ